MSFFIVLPIFLGIMDFRFDLKKQHFPFGENIPTFFVDDELSNQINRQAHICDLMI